MFLGGGGCFNKSKVSILVKQTEVHGWDGLDADEQKNTTEKLRNQKLDNQK